jgi:hypothetical protein
MRCAYGYHPKRPSVRSENSLEHRAFTTAAVLTIALLGKRDIQAHSAYEIGAFSVSQPPIGNRERFLGRAQELSMDFFRAGAWWKKEGGGEGRRPHRPCCRPREI